MYNSIIIFFLLIGLFNSIKAFPDPCPEGVEESVCLHYDYCQGKKCDRYPDAICDLNSCGYYPNYRCPEGIEEVTCLGKDYCQGRQCHGYPDAICVLNICGYLGQNLEKKEVYG
ncbi:unnamed protein product [Gordionus sp. m RMFG-2023]